MKPDSAIDIIRQLRAKGHDAYLVGGCVRDMVMKIEPADYDIATGARPEEVMTIFPRTEPVGAQFGVVLVIHRGHPFEVATFRSDEAYVDGRRPTGVVFTGAREDVLRRDFTINGLLYDPIEARLIDYVNGRQDIDAKIVRCIGEPRQRFEEDKLRMLRAIRFGARLGYRIEAATWQAVCHMAPGIHQVSRERIREELVRILTEGQAAHGMQMLEDSGLRREILPELEWTPHIQASVEKLPPAPPADFAVAVLLHEMDTGAVQQVVERLKFSKAEAHHILALIENLPKFSEVRQMKVSRLKRFFRIPRFEEHLQLTWIHAMAAGMEPADWMFAASQYSSLPIESIAPPPLISGADLIALGYVPGPLFREILTRVEDEQLEGNLETRERALDFVMANFGKAGSS